MRTNKKAKDYRKDESARLAGGYGPFAAKQGAEALLRRSVMANLLWENVFYENGISVADNIKALIPQVDPERVAAIAVEARTEQKLRHVPLLLAREMCRHNTHKGLVGDLLPQIILRPDELSEFVSIYWMDGKEPLASQAKKGLAAAFHNFDEYQLAKWDQGGRDIKLRDVMFLVHPNPGQKEDLFKRLAEGNLQTPDTWEVALSAGKDKRHTWERLIRERKLGALAFIRNLRNMEQAGVDPGIIREGFETINPRWLLPLNFISAAKHAPRWERELETLMLRGLSLVPRLPGYSILIVDVSGSMHGAVSGKSEMTRMDAAAALTMFASEVCERIAVYATAGNDPQRKHSTSFVKPRRGFALADAITGDAYRTLGGGGIFTRQALEYVKEHERETPDRIMIFSDSQDCDRPHLRTPAPFGKHNYIIDISAHTRGINYNGLWDAEISGWSERFLSFIAALEGASLQ